MAQSVTFVLHIAALGRIRGDLITVDDPGQIAFLDSFSYASRVPTFSEDSIEVELIDDEGQDELLGVLVPEGVEDDPEDDLDAEDGDAAEPAPTKKPRQR